MAAFGAAGGTDAAERQGASDLSSPRRAARRDAQHRGGAVGSTAPADHVEAGGERDPARTRPAPPGERGVETGLRPASRGGHERPAGRPANFSVPLAVRVRESLGFSLPLVGRETDTFKPPPRPSPQGGGRLTHSNPLPDPPREIGCTPSPTLPTMGRETDTFRSPPRPSPQGGGKL